MNGDEDKRKPIAETNFAVEARLAVQLGRESISSSITAILELVKNAYDANATRVRIRFKHPGTKNAVMVVQDNGTGMTIDELRNYWLVIGTANKRKTRKNKVKRVLTGEKGLGRLGLDRLAQNTTIQSAVKGASDAIELPIDWRKFEQEETRLEDIRLKVYGISNFGEDPLTGEVDEFHHGTRIILRNLKDDWNKDTLEELRGELALLVSPFSERDDFSIELESGLEIDSIDGPVSAPLSLIRAALWKVTASINDEGQVQMRMDSKHHRQVYEEGPMSWESRFPGMGNKPVCGPLQFDFYFFPRVATTLDEKTITVAEIKKFLSSNQGLRIYRDGFRVKPYGNPDGGGDWLRLAYRRMTNPEGVAQDEKPGNWRVGYNQVAGAVFVSRKNNSQLLDQTNREGLVDGKAFSHLRAFAEATIRFFELNHQDFEMSKRSGQSARDKAKGQADEAFKQLDKAAGAIASIVESKQSDETGETEPVETESDPKELLAQVQKALTEAREKLDESSKTFKAEEERESREKDTMANLASLGILAAAFGHETLGWASSCAANAGWLERNLPNNFFFTDTETEQKVKEKLTDTSTQARRIETFAGFSIGNVKPAKRRRTTFCLKKLVKHVFGTFDESLRVQRNIELDVDENLPEEACLIKGYPIDWESVLVNLITNAEWALRERKEVYQRKIRVTLTRSDEPSFILTFEDNGIGIPAGQEDRIFLPTYSTKRNTGGQIFGTGMGLTIVKNFVEQNTGGSITAKAKGKLGGALFTLRIPAAGESTE